MVRVLPTLSWRLKVNKSLWLVFDWDIKIEKPIDTTTPPQHDYHHRHCCNPDFRNLVKFQDMGKCRMKQQTDLSPETLTAADICSCTLVSYLVLQRSKWLTLAFNNDMFIWLIFCSKYRKESSHRRKLLGLVGPTPLTGLSHTSGNSKTRPTESSPTQLATRTILEMWKSTS